MDEFVSVFFLVGPFDQQSELGMAIANWAKNEVRGARLLKYLAIPSLVG